MTAPAKRPPVPIAQLLLLLSRPRLDDETAARALRLCDEITDWNLLATIAVEKYCVPWVFEHLSALHPEGIPVPVMQTMQQVTMGLSMQTMRVVAEQLRFQKNCLQALDVAHVFIKGPGLAARYHANPLLRYSRDIDVLVRAADQTRVLESAIAQGYLVWDDPDADPKTPNAAELSAMMRYEGTVTLVSKEDIVIEVHRDIDKFSGLFHPEELLSDTLEIPITNGTTRVLPTAKLFCYVCYHHTRHIWSKLHWLTDLDAIITHPDFDTAAVLRYAEERGLRPTVEACLELHRLTLMPETWEDVAPDNHGRQLLELCLDNLMGDQAFEYAQRARFGLLAIPFDWMLDKTQVRPVMMRHLMTRLKPNYVQYAHFPLPAHLQFLYYFTRPLGALKRRLVGTGRAK